MKDKLASYLRHALTFLPALGVFFVSKGWLEPQEGATLDKELTDFLSVVAGMVASGLVRLLMLLVAKHAPHLKTILGGVSGGSAAVAMTATAWGAILAGALLTSCLVTGCTPAQVDAFRAMPITIGVEGEHGNYGYSSKGGLSVTMKTPKVREEKSGVNVMLILEREWECGRFAEPALSPHRPYRPRRITLWDDRLEQEPDHVTR